jgi:hypothetical protein
MEKMLKDKLKTTPDPAITWIRKSFRVDWQKIAKKCIRIVRGLK